MASVPSFLRGLNSRVRANTEIDARGSGSSSSDGTNFGSSTLMEYVGKGGINVGDDDLVVLFAHLEYAFKRIAALVASPFNSSLGKDASIAGAASGSLSDRDKPKPLDIVSVR